MDCTRSQRVSDRLSDRLLAHSATAGAFLICLAVAGGLVGTNKSTPPQLEAMAEPSLPTWTTSSATSNEVGPAAMLSTPIEPSKTNAMSTEAAPAPVVSAAPTYTTASTEAAPPTDRKAVAEADTAIEPETSSAVAALPPPIEIGNLSRAVLQLADTASAESDMVGLWAPDASACSVRSFRQGLLPTIINTEGAWAGETFCMFKNRKTTESGWRVVAECSSGGDHWTTQVRLSLKGQRLIWESKRGRQVYTRCGPDLHMAAVP